MFDNANPTPVLHRSPRLSPSADAQLPRGECSFILSDVQPGASPRQRCSCRSFYADNVVRSRCGCGHQAWHHEAQPANPSVSLDEHNTVIEEVKRLRQQFEERCRILERELNHERDLRMKLERTRDVQYNKTYWHMMQMGLKLEDRIEAVVDKSQDTHDLALKLREKVEGIEDMTMELEARIDHLDIGSDPQTPSPPVAELENRMETHTLAQLPIRTEKRPPARWSCRLMLIPNKSQTHAYEYDSNGFRRLASRNLVQEVTVQERDSGSFVSCVETLFKLAFRGRPWMPLTGFRPSDEPYGRIVLSVLNEEHVDRNKWDHSFLDSECVVHDKMLGDILFIALQNEQMTWHEIKFLPAAAGAENDNSCWEHDDELDVRLPSFESLDAQLMYDRIQPPPYSSRTHSEFSERQPSKLDVLAASASMLSPRQQQLQLQQQQQQSQQPQVPQTPPTPRHPRAPHPVAPSVSSADVRSISDRSISDRSCFSERSAPSVSGTSVSEMADDEHRDKKLRTKWSMPIMHNNSGASGSHSGSSTQMYVSGRSKRKLNVRDGKVKEPVRFTEWRPIQTFRHRNDNKDKQPMASSPPSSSHGHHHNAGTAL